MLIPVFIIYEKKLRFTNNSRNGGTNKIKIEIY